MTRSVKPLSAVSSLDVRYAFIWLVALSLVRSSSMIIEIFMFGPFSAYGHRNCSTTRTDLLAKRHDVQDAEEEEGGGG